MSGGEPLTFVLVHGAWHGGWCWRFVAERLRAAGHIVYTPTLTGLGERAHLAGPSVDLSTHFQDVANLILCEELTDVILVGHSLSGKVIAGAASLVPDRVAKLIYLDAHLPTPGEPAVGDLFATFKLDPSAGAPPTIAPIADASAFGIAASQTELLEWVDRRLTPHPVQCFLEAYPPSRMPPDRPRLYIRCDNGPGPNVLTVFQDRIKSEPGWTIMDMATGHDAMITVPEELSAMFMEWARR